MASSNPREYTEQEIMNMGYDETTGFVGSSLGTQIAGERNIGQSDSYLATRGESNYTNLTASALIKTGAGHVKGVLVNSHTTGTLKLWDNTSAATTVLANTMSFAVGERYIPIPDGQFATGLYATIGGTADVTIFWK